MPEQRLLQPLHLDGVQVVGHFGLYGGDFLLHGISPSTTSLRPPYFLKTFCVWALHFLSKDALDDASGKYADQNIAHATGTARVA